METLPQLFRYTAREYDANTGLYHYRARTYDPATGRFLQEDPIWFAAGDLNVHRYVWNNPVNWVDPSGMIAAMNYARVGGATGAGTLAGLTIPSVRTLVLITKAAGEAAIIYKVLQREFVDGVGLVCKIGLNLASIGATIAGASDVGLAAGGCSVVWNEKNDEYSGHGTNPEGKTGSGSTWDKHSGKRSGQRVGVRKNNNRGAKNKKYIKPKNPNKR